MKNEPNDSNRFSRALSSLAQLAEKEGIPIAIVGGLAAIRYGHAVATQDIGVAIAKTDLERIVRSAPGYGFKVTWESKIGWHNLLYGDVEINVVPEGGRARDDAPTVIPSPAAMGVVRGLEYAQLQSWVELKISSNRQKDRGHVVEVLKRLREGSTDKFASHLRNVHDDYFDTFQLLLAQAKAEREQEEKRR